MILDGMRTCYRINRTSGAGRGFTLIELLVVLAIIAALLAIATPRYFRSVDQSREVALKQSLSVMRDAIDKFYGDQGAYPESLEALVEKRYLRSVPVDPVTESAATWQIVAPAEPIKGKVYNVRSGAEGRAADGTEYKEW
jgi:general secretion pathway protein G